MAEQIIKGIFQDDVQYKLGIEGGEKVHITANGPTLMDLYNNWNSFKEESNFIYWGTTMPSSSKNQIKIWYNTSDESWAN